MVHCIHSNKQQHKQENKKKDNSNYLDIDEVSEEMMLLSTKEKNANTTESTNPTATIKSTTKSISTAQTTTTTKHQPPPSPTTEKLKSEAYSVLSYDQVKRLDNVIEQVVPIHGRGNFPTLDVKLKDLVKIVRTKLETEQSIRVSDIRLNGGAASYVLLPENSSYNDLDLIFQVDLIDHSIYDKIRTAVLDSLLEFLPKSANKERISPNSLKDAYIDKMVKVNEKVDKWSLISLSNNTGRNVELKFVDTMVRQFEFSVDSFHIILDSLMLFYECQCSEMPISENIYPTVLAESVYGDFNEAFSHLENKIIATRQVEQIRGGGLLKYCNLLIRNYQPLEDIKKIERYMCSRFFIDFSDLSVQRNKLESYLANHFNNDDWTKTQYLMQLYKVVDESTVCLMSHERRQTLALIEEMAYRFYIRSQQQSPTATNQHTPHHYPLHIPHLGKSNQQQFFPHFHHHLIRHPHYDLIMSNNVAAQQQSNNSKQQSDSNNNASNKTSSSESNNSSSNVKGNNSSTNSKNTNSSSSQQSIHSNHQAATNNNSNSSKNTKNQQQHIQQQYHAYLFGTNANTFYHYNPYHQHHSMHHQHNGCFNSMSCQCGVWIGGCA